MPGGQSEGQPFLAALESLLRLGVQNQVGCLPDKQIERLRAAIGRFTRGRRVEIAATVDPSLIGGLVVAAGDRVVDGSVAGWLKRMQDRLVRRTE